jgi:hypothetical protein
MKNVLLLLLLAVFAGCAPGDEADESLAATSSAVVVPIWRSAVDTGRCVGTANGGSMANYTQLVVWGCHGGVDQQWQVTPEGWIRNRTSGKCVGTANGGSMVNYTPLVIWDCTNSPDQRWYVTAGNELRNRFSGKCIGTANGGSLADYTHLVVWDCQGSPDQKWQFSPNPPTVQVSLDSTLPEIWIQGTASPSSSVTIDFDGASAQVADTDANGFYKKGVFLSCAWPAPNQPAPVPTRTLVRVVDASSQLEVVVSSDLLDCVP